MPRTLRQVHLRVVFCGERTDIWEDTTGATGAGIDDEAGFQRFWSECKVARAANAESFG
jgi:hypothetical protein